MICQICKKEMKRIGSHIIRQHNLSLQVYYDTYLKKENEDICYCGKKKEFGRDLSEAYNDFCSPSCAVKNKDIQIKMRKTCFKNSGFENPLMNDNLKRQGMIKKYGVEYALQFKEIQEKIKETLLNRYNVDHPSKISLVKDKKTQTQILHFGDLYCRTPEARLIYRQNFIHNIENQKGSYQVQRGKNEQMILDELEKIFEIIIQRDFTYFGFYPDGYIKELNLVIEIYEEHHRHTCYLDYDERRKNTIIENLNCNFFIIWEKDWLTSKEQVISQFKSVIEFISKEQKI